MTTTELLVFFAIAMLAIALLAIAVDWVGKPIRRRFMPKMYRFPEELGHAAPVDPSLTGWSDQYFVIPDELTTTGGHLLEWPDIDDVMLDDEVELVSPTIPEPAPAPFDYAADGDDELPSDEADAASALPERGLGWQRGQYVYNLVGNGSEPSADIVRTRFWKNVSATDYAAVFGAVNVDRMSRGRPPRRRNPRTQRDESMRLAIASFEEVGGRPPKPAWPTVEIDPFDPSTP